MNQDLTALMTLQEMDLQIQKLGALVEGKIPELLAAEQKAALLGRRIQNLTDQHKETQKNAALKEMELRDHEGKIQRYREQLNEIKDNKQYKALLSEIGTESRTSEQFELEALEAYEQAASMKKELADIWKLLEGIQEEIQQLGERNRVATAAAVIELKGLLAKRGETVSGLDGGLLQKYEKVLRSRGSALSPVRGRSCQGCFMSVPPQIYNQLLAVRGVTFCHSCGRILYLESEE